MTRAIAGAIALVSLSAHALLAAAPASPAPEGRADPPPTFAVEGAWSYSSLPGHEPGKTSIYSNDPHASATWTPRLRCVGPVRISLYLVTHETSTPRATIEVRAAGRSGETHLDLTAGEPRWATLGTFAFDGGGRESVRARRDAPGHLRLAALRLEILDGAGGAIWQTIVLDDLFTHNLSALRRSAPDTLRGGPPEPDQWELAFHDEFDGDSLDPAVWKSAQGETWGRLLSARFPENAIVRDGLLRLVTRKEKRGGKGWTTAMISTKAFRQKYGYWESRYRYAPATGLNQAFWIHPRTADKASGFEIDINEGHYPTDVNATLHQGGLPSRSKRFVADYDLSADFHIYAVLWDEREVIFFFDGREIHRVPNTKAHLEAPVIYSTAVLTWAGPVTDALDARSMDVDWVRVYRRKSAGR